MTKVKICGITNLDDALCAQEAGADYLGFILYPPSKRATDEKAVQCMVAHLRSLENCPALVGVLVNESAETATQILDFCQLDFIQLHGNEPPFMVGDPKSPLYGRAYKAIKPQSFAEAEADVEWYKVVAGSAENPLIPDIMIDAYHPTLYGGTGETSDWEIARKLMVSTPGLMLAGGLTPQNVATAIRQVQPFVVDVASGVEASTGKKDHAAVEAFIKISKQTSA